MAAKYTYTQVVARLKASTSNISCTDLKKMLGDLGFEVIKGTKGNHHRFKHPKIPTFFGGKFDCQPTLLPCYPRDVLSILIDLESELNPQEGEKK